MRIKSIAIVGLGLMGGSLAGACRKEFPRARIIGVTRNRSALNLAKKKRWIHEGFSKLNENLSDVDLFVLCVPVDKIEASLKTIDKLAKPGAIVTDVGSVKANIRSAIAKKKWKRIHFISAHPMVGSHEKGMKAADAKLYKDGLTFLISHSSQNPKARTAVKNFWAKLCAKVVAVKTDEHDKIVAQISHLPHAIAIALIQSIPNKVLGYASTGFRDVTRIAQGNPEIWLPIFKVNKKQILSAVSQFKKNLDQFLKAERSKQPAKLKKIVTQAVKKRSQI